LKETISEHQRNINAIEKALDFDEQWQIERIKKRRRELEFYKRQLQTAIQKKMLKFDRNKFLT